MSIFFVTNEGNDIWNPGRVTAQMFCAQVTSIAREVGVESGLGAIISDQVIVDVEKFKAFAVAFAKYMLCLQPNDKAWTLLAGCFSFVGALAERLGAKPGALAEGLDTVVHPTVNVTVHSDPAGADLKPAVGPELARLIANGIRLIS